MRLFLFWWMVVGLVACGGQQAQQPDLGRIQAACVAKRTVRQLECVDLYSTRPEIDACRAGVQAALDCTAIDGGAEDAGGE